MKKLVNSIVFTLFFGSGLIATHELSRSEASLQTRRRSNHVLELEPNAKVQLAFTSTRKPFISDRKYLIRKLPRGVKGSSMVVRNSGSSNNWLAGKQVVTKQACTVYVAIQTGRSGKLLVPADLVKKMEDAGWKTIKGFQTTSPAKEVWAWTTFSQSIPKGPVKLTNPTGGARTNYVFMFR